MTLRIYLEEIDLGFNMDVGAPKPTVISNDSYLYLLFYIYDLIAKRDGSGEKSIDNSPVVIKFKNYSKFKFGLPNDETCHGHPYYKYGLRPYSFFRVHNSDWIEELEKINSVHPLHNKAHFASYKHFLIFFHDRCFEAVAESYEVKVIHKPLKEAALQVLETLFNQ